MNIIIRIALIATSIVFAGCSSFTTMQKSTLQEQVSSDKVMVNFVRRSVFMGDGVDVELWDGDSAIGTLGAGELMQYETTPGKHTFMVYVQGSWGLATGNLKPGKTYYLKFNMNGLGGISLGAADADDERIPEWNTMSVVRRDTSVAPKVPEKYTLKALDLLRDLETGKINATQIRDVHAL